MRAPAFWWGSRSFAASLLAPLGLLYGATAGARMRRCGVRCGIPVVCVGNPVVGGAGKTPAALAIARLLIAAGERPYFLTRGYGSRNRVARLVDIGRHHAGEVGDEPLLLARVAPTVVARHRPEGAILAKGLGASVIVMDDGFQNPSLYKNAKLLVIDGRRGLGNARIFPAGPLRAPWPAQIEQADALLIIGEILSAAGPVAQLQARGVRVFKAKLVPHLDASGLPNQPLLAFAGIADPEKFFATLEAAGMCVALRRTFPDHYRYKPRDAHRLLTEADAKNLVLVTTEKDFVRFAGDQALTALARKTRVLPVKLVLDEETEFRSFLLARIGRDPMARMTSV